MADKDNYLKVTENQSSSGSGTDGDSDDNDLNNLDKSGKRLTVS